VLLKTPQLRHITFLRIAPINSFCLFSITDTKVTMADTGAKKRGRPAAAASPDEVSLIKYSRLCDQLLYSWRSNGDFTNHFFFQLFPQPETKKVASPKKDEAKSPKKDDVKSPVAEPAKRGRGRPPKGKKKAVKPPSGKGRGRPKQS
jgi:hypothetical protein